MLTSAAATGLSQFAPPVAHSILLLLIISIAMPSIAGIESRWMGSLQRVAVAGCYMAIIGFFATRMMPSSGTLIALVVVAFSAWLLPIVRSPERVGLLSMTSVAVLGVVPLFA